jgi:hypothetical protein
MTKPAVWKHGRRFWTPKRVVSFCNLIFSLAGFLLWFFVGFITVPWAISLWRKHWNDPKFGYRSDGTVAMNIFTEMC